MGILCTVSTYASAEDMLSVFARGKVDVAFLDVRMEGGIDARVEDGIFSCGLVLYHK